jgi:hypothetical protein
LRSGERLTGCLIGDTSGHLAALLRREAQGDQQSEAQRQNGAQAGFPESKSHCSAPHAKELPLICGEDNGKTGFYSRTARYIGLATTSAGNDDVALEVNNAANGNLIHGASA